MRLKAVQLLVNDVLPEELRDYSRPLDEKGISKLMAQVAISHPDKYGTVVKAIGDAGRQASYKQGETLTLRDMEPVIDRAPLLALMDKEVAEARAAIRSEPDFEQARNSIWGKYSNSLEKATQDAAMTKGNNLAYSVVSGARGKPAQLKAMLTTPGLYADASGKIVPVFVRNSFGDGLRPAEALAGSYGARSTVLATKIATAKGGYFCLGQGTMVRMGDFTLRAIETLKPGDWVLGADKTGATFPVRVTRVFDQGLQPVFEHTFRQKSAKWTFSERSTETHKFLMRYQNYETGNSWSGVRPIAEFTQRHTLISQSGFSSASLTREPFALMLGLMLGDGYMPADKPKSRVAFSCFDLELLKDASPSLAAAGHYFSSGSPSKVHRMSRTELSGRSFRLWLINECGLGGKHAGDKFIPALVKSWDNESTGALLAGLWATDGTITSGRRVASSTGKRTRTVYLNLASSSKQMLEELRDLCTWRFGITGSSVQLVRKAGRYKVAGQMSDCQNGYAWCITRVPELVKMLEIFEQFLPGKKRSKLPLLRQFIQRAEKDTPNGFSLVSSKLLGNKPCWDIEVDHPDHLFVLGSGLISSNSKLLTQASANQIITAKDCGASSGIDLDIGDDSLKHRILLRDVGGLTAGTLLDRHAMSQLKAKGVKNVMVRSPLTCEAVEGVCAKCAGADAKGHLPRIGEAVGITSSHATGEPLTQGALREKHEGGAAKAQKQFVGLDVVNRFAQSPEVFEDKATVSKLDGSVTSIEEAPQGGSFVTIGDEKHYVPQGFAVSVKPGQKVEAGDIISDGLGDPADVVQFKGIGAGRRYYAERLKKIMDDSGHKTDLRHTEMVARAAINHVLINDNDGPEGSLPGDTLAYNAAAGQHIPPEDTVNAHPSKLIGQFLQAPALHFTIGTRITPSVVSRLDGAGWGNVHASQEEPHFEPEMIRIQSSSHNNPDWLAGQHTSHLRKSLTDHAIRGSDTNVAANTHFAPRLAIGEGFGKDIEETGKF